MKHLFFLILSFSFALIVSAQSTHTPKLVIDKPERDLGTLYKADSVKVFGIHFKNEGDGDLYIQEIATSCGCLKIRNLEDYECTKFPPGSEATLIVDFNLNISPQDFYKEIYFYSNASPEGKSINVLLTGKLVNGKP